MTLVADTQRDGYFWFGVVASAATIVALVLVFVFYLRAKRDTDLRIYFEGSVVVDPGTESEITVLLHGDTVDRVTRTRVTMWNAGRGALENSKVIHPLGVRFPDGVEIFSVVRSDSRTSELDVDLDIKDNEVTMVPRYLNKGDEFSVEITHNGKSPREGVKAIGTVVGARPVRTQKFRDATDVAVYGFLCSVIVAISLTNLPFMKRQQWWLIVPMWIALPVFLTWLVWLVARRWALAGRRRH